ncbi:DUF3788 domain-containing protein [Bacillus massiliigorillae]|uniref:DUF3788 domain-containing protein n=1 Tax=Bacillus massiliigorillae TaxID=1243664 RepID=UPI0003A71447|nr:DUF3788 domain-containing protein [Bacillus massiliigorillae]
MEWKDTFLQECKPTLEQVESFINNPLWSKLMDNLQDTYHISPQLQYSGCSMQKGWNIRFKKRGKSLCTLYPMKGYFLALVVVGAKEMEKAELLLPFCSTTVQEIFNKADLYIGGKWLMVPVLNHETLQDLRSLISLRVAPQK